jgi:CRISPR-associated endonuclease/helicase Cas3
MKGKVRKGGENMIAAIDFEQAFRALTGHAPFPWQRQLYQRFLEGPLPPSCNIPTGLGKTAVVAIWLIALANASDRVPRRLVYVVNRRTVVDQTTTEAEKMRRNATAAGVPTPAISTLRGQFADNREWSADPSKPAIIAGTVDMIGSRLLFSGYGIGFKSRPLHAGFLGQDVLLVHDEAHLEPAFQELIVNIQREQHERERAEKVSWPKLRVMELTATSRGNGTVFALSDKDRADTEVQRRIGAKKVIHLHENKDEKKLADEIAELALKHKGSGRDVAVLVFVRKVDDVDKIVKKLPKDAYEQLTGTLRGLERDNLVKKPIFQRFLPESNRDKNVTLAEGTVYLACTSAGEVGVNISADHLVCDLSTFDSMAQRFGRVNRFGDHDDTRIDIVYPKEKDLDEKDEYDSRLKKTLELLRQLNGDGSPAALGKLDENARLAAFAPSPTVLPVSDILFDSWALTTIRGKLPGRPPVEPYLHGLSDELPETHVAWREEVWVLRLKFKNEADRKKQEVEERKRLARFATELLDDYPLKPHELLRDNSSRVFDRLKKLGAPAETPVWIVSDDDSVEVTTLGELIDAGKDELNYKTVLLPPAAGGLENGMLTAGSTTADDVADEWRNETGVRRRVRVWDGDSQLDDLRKIMRLVRRIDFPAPEDDEDAEGRSWHWFELPSSGDSDGSKTNKLPVCWKVHTDDVINHATDFVKRLPLSDDLKRAVIFAARWHDLGKKREIWQRSIGNPTPTNWLGKSGGKMKPRELTDYRHEFGSLMDILDPEQPFLTEFQSLSDELQDVVLHLIAVHHGLGRPHFPPDNAFDPNAKEQDAANITAQVPQRFARLQRKYGRWGLAYLESLLRAADWAASAKPSAFVEDQP